MSANTVWSAISENERNLNLKTLVFLYKHIQIVQNIIRFFAQCRHKELVVLSNLLVALVIYLCKLFTYEIYLNLISFENQITLNNEAFVFISTLETH